MIRSVVVLSKEFGMGNKMQKSAIEIRRFKKSEILGVFSVNASLMDELHLKTFLPFQCAFSDRRSWP